MRNIAVIAIILLAVCYEADAGKQPLCSYKNVNDDTIFLTYMSTARRGEEYVDFDDSTGKCVKRATCNDKFKTEVDDCSKYSITCQNKQRYEGVFPGCCVKC